MTYAVVAVACQDHKTKKTITIARTDSSCRGLKSVYLGVYMLNMKCEGNEVLRPISHENEITPQTGILSINSYIVLNRQD